MHAKFFASSGSATVISSIINWHKKINQELNSQINIAFGTTTIKENEDNPTNNDEQYNKANLELTNSSVTSTHGSSKRFGCFFSLSLTNYYLTTINRMYLMVTQHSYKCIPIANTTECTHHGFL